MKNSIQVDMGLIWCELLKALYFLFCLTTYSVRSVFFVETRFRSHRYCLYTLTFDNALFKRYIFLKIAKK